jgi:hypothetical protein
MILTAVAHPTTSLTPSPLFSRVVTGPWALVPHVILCTVSKPFPSLCAADWRASSVSAHPLPRSCLPRAADQRARPRCDPARQRPALWRSFANSPAVPALLAHGTRLSGIHALAPTSLSAGSNHVRCSEIGRLAEPRTPSRGSFVKRTLDFLKINPSSLGFARRPLTF